MHRIETDEFALELEMNVVEADIENPVNTLLNVTVRSYGFSAATTMDIDIKKFFSFAKELLELYQTLSGQARLEEPYGMHNYIGFEAVKSGHIKVKGMLHNGHRHGYSQALTFENEIDQTNLQDFAKELFDEYSRI